MSRWEVTVDTLKTGIKLYFVGICGKERADEMVEIVEELEHLAEIGRATEMVFKEFGSVISGGALWPRQWHNSNALIEWHDRRVEDAEELLEWHRAQEVQHESD